MSRRAEPAATALETAQRLLALRERTTHQVRVALQERGFQQDEVEAALARLTTLGMLSDARAAEVAARRLFRALSSRQRVEQQLLALGLSSQQVTAAIEQVSTELGMSDAMMATALLRRRRITGLRAARFLAQRGFDESLIRRLIGEAHFDGT
jgi:regulatory protein